MRNMAVNRAVSVKLVLGFVASTSMVFTLPGCGGGGTGSSFASSRSGKATITVAWPTRSRLIPAASNSIKIEVKQGTLVVGTKTVARPADGVSTTVTIDPLPTGDLVAFATAFPQPDGSGAAQAAGSIPLHVDAGQSTAFTLTMGSTVDHLEIGPATPTAAVGRTRQMTMTAKDAAGAIVLTTPSKLEWKSSNTGVASIDASGVVKGKGMGSSVITVTDTESTKSATITFNVTAVGPIAFTNSGTYEGAGSEYIVAMDFDGDGKCDLASGLGNDATVLWGKGDGTFEPVAKVGTWINGLLVRAAADVDRDGKIDLLATDGHNNALVMRNLGNRTFGQPIPYQVGDACTTIGVGDFNGDGFPDMVVGNDQFNSVGLAILINKGDGTFKPATYVGVGALPIGVNVADLDGDGKMDIIHGYGSSTVGGAGTEVLWGNGDGTFTTGFNMNHATQAVIYVAAADLDGDGKLDVISGDYWDNSVGILINAGNKTYNQPSTYLAGQYNLGLAIADFDGDGKPDIAFANAGTSHASVLKNRGDGIPLSAVEFQSGGSNCRGLASGDFDGDGFPDLAIGNGDQGSITVLLNK